MNPKVLYKIDFPEAYLQDSNDIFAQDWNHRYVFKLSDRDPNFPSTTTIRTRHTDVSAVSWAGVGPAPGTTHLSAQFGMCMILSQFLTALD